MLALTPKIGRRKGFSEKWWFLRQFLSTGKMTLQPHGSLPSQQHDALNPRRAGKTGSTLPSGEEAGSQQSTCRCISGCRRRQETSPKRRRRGTMNLGDTRGGPVARVWGAWGWVGSGRVIVTYLTVFPLGKKMQMI